MIVLENEFLAVGVLTKGAELASVVDKVSGQERIWQKQPDVWNRHAPLLFPYCGRIKSGTILVEGKEYPTTAHGFARDMEFFVESQTQNSVCLQLRDSTETQRMYPFSFVLMVRYTLEKNQLRQEVTVSHVGTDERRVMPFGLGFHPAFALPFGKGTKTKDFELVFEQEESALEIKMEQGFVTGEKRPIFSKQKSIALEDSMFANDSICLSGLQSSFIELRDTKSHASMRMNISGFPYLLLWSVPKQPLPFICLEPWISLPDPVEEYGEFINKPFMQHLKVGESQTTALSMVFTN